MNNEYLKRGDLFVEQLPRGFAWLDTGTHDSLLQAGSFVQTVVQMQNLQVACLEEIAFDNGWIGTDKLREQGEFFGKTEYGKYILQILGRQPKLE